MVRYQNDVIIISSDMTLNALTRFFSSLELFLFMRIKDHLTTVDFSLRGSDLVLTIEISKYDCSFDIDRKKKRHKNQIEFSGKSEGYKDSSDFYVLTKTGITEFENCDYTPDEVCGIIKEFIES